MSLAYSENLIKAVQLQQKLFHNKFPSQGAEYFPVGHSQLSTVICSLFLPSLLQLTSAQHFMAQPHGCINSKYINTDMQESTLNEHQRL